MASENDEKAIQEEFLASWDELEKFFVRLFFMLPIGDVDTETMLGLIAELRPLGLLPIKDVENKKAMLDVIIELRQKGCDRQFRAGQSLDMLKLSRSREHGLRNDQAWVGMFLIPESGMRVVYSAPPNEWIEVDLEKVEVTPEVEELLQRLLSHPID